MDKHFAIAYSCDDIYAQHVGISLISLLDNNSWLEGVSVYIVDGGISIDNKHHLRCIADSYGINLRFINLDEVFNDFDYTLSFSRNSYARLFLADIIKENFVWNFDADTIIAGDLSPLQEINMEGKLLAGVQDTVNPYYTQVIGLAPDQKYINAGGIIIINCNLWRSENISSTCRNYIEHWNGKPPFDDQGVLNHVCRGRTVVLPAIYNVMPPMFKFDSDCIRSLFKMCEYYSQDEIAEVRQSPRLIHFTAEFFNRPWFSNCTHPHKEIYLKYKSLSPWRDAPLTMGQLSRNCRIQNFVYDYLPFSIYKAMIRLIELRHRLRRLSGLKVF